MYSLIVLMTWVLSLFAFFFGIRWLHGVVTMPQTTGRLRHYGMGLLLWACAWLAFWSFYVIVDSLAWRAGAGDYLIHRPWAAIHHRVMGSHDWLEDVFDDPRERETQEKRLRTPLMLGKATGIISLSYLVLVVLPVETVSRSQRRLRENHPGRSS